MPGRRSARHGGKVAPRGTRRDIQGLRAVAIIAVLLDHVLGWPAGGFVGVDVFFVVSGFLITGHLLRGIERDGRVHFADFYRRRVKRILPAALLVLVTASVVAWWFLNLGRFWSVLTDAVFAALFTANWHFAVLGTDYFQAAGPPSPFQHFWSLAVEEQFYVAWPWLLLLAALVARKRGAAAVRRASAVVIVVVLVGSFAWALLESAQNPSWAYFSTASRAWELAVGGLLAVASGALERIPGGARVWLSSAGQAVIVVSLFVTSGSSGFPAPGAALPVLGAALVIAAGTGGEAFAPVLTNRVAGWLGDLSYSLYLWHFPVLMLLGVVVEPDAPLFLVLCFGLTLLLSTTGYYLVEQPIRRSHLFERRSPRPAAARHARPARGHRARRLLPVWTGAVAGAALCAVITIAMQPAPAPAVAAPRGLAARGVSSPSPTPTVDPQVARVAALRTALAATSWPQLTPSVDQLETQGRVPEWTKDGCLAVSAANVSSCTWGPADAPRTAVVVGDSIALSWLPAIRGALEPLGYRVVDVAAAQCPAADIGMRDWEHTGDFAAKCRTHVHWEEAEVARLKPDLVIASSAQNTLVRLADWATGSAAMDEWEQGQVPVLKSLSAHSHVVVLQPPPSGRNLQTCATRFNGPKDCIGHIPTNYADFFARSSAAAKAAGATPLATLDWFCVGGRCPSFVGTAPMFAEGSHLTGPSSAALAGPLRAALASRGLLVAAGG